MSIKLLRESSETPNIANTDDAKMIRYAYGGYTGYIQNYLSGIHYVMDGSIFKLRNGLFVVNGWEVELKNNSYQLDLSNISGTVFYAVYAELNIATETVQIKSTYLNSDYPEIDPGDDLTRSPGGTARVLLYHIKSVNKTASEVIKKIKPIPYLTEIEERLERLGFRQGELTFTEEALSVMDGSPSKNIITRQGNYVIAEIECYMDVSLKPGNKLIIANIPEEFRPKNNVVVSSTREFGSSGTIFIKEFTINEHGELSMSVTEHTPMGYNVWCKGVLNGMSFGYEANPL